MPEATGRAGVDEAALLRRASFVAGSSGEPERAVAFARPRSSSPTRAGDAGDGRR